MTQWWEQSFSTNVAPEFEYRRRSHIRVLRFSSLLKNHPYFQITIRSGTHGHLDLLCFMGEQITIFLTLFKVKRTCFYRFSPSPAPLGVLQYPVTILKVTTSDKWQFEPMSLQCCDAVLRQNHSLYRTFTETFLHSSIIQAGLKTDHYCEERYHKPSS